MASFASKFRARTTVIQSAQNGSDYNVSGGQSQINFDIASTRNVIMNKSVLLNGTINVYASGTTNPTGTEDLKFDGYSGLVGMIDSINLRSKNSGVLLGRIQHPGRYTAEHNATTNSGNMLLQKFNQYAGSDQIGLSKSACETEFTFSIPLSELLGFFNVCQEHLLSDLGGLRIEILLSSNNMFLVDTGDSFTGASYVLSNVKLSYVQLEPSLEYLAMGGKSMSVYEDWNINMLQLVSSQDSLEDHVNKASLKSMGVSFLPSSDYNNRTANSYAMAPIAVSDVSLNTNGVQHPLRYSQTQDPAVNTNYNTLAVEYLKAMNTNASLNGVRSVLNIDDYSTATDNPQFGVGWLYSNDGVPVLNSNVSMHCQSDNNQNRSAFFTYKYNKIIEAEAGNVMVKA